MSDEKNDSMDSLKFQSFDIGEMCGGEQLIIDYRTISPGKYYVMTLGNGSKIDLPPNANIKDLEEKYLKNRKIEANDKETAYDNIKIRFFKLTLMEDGRYSVDEYVTLESISKVAKLFV